jgi:hypothetical protein
MVVLLECRFDGEASQGVRQNPPLGEPRTGQRLDEDRLKKPGVCQEPDGNIVGEWQSPFKAPALPQTPHLHKHAAVERNLEPRLRTLLAMLCVALSFVFAGTSAASVVDDVQHSTTVTHEHGLHLGFTLADDDHHADHHDDGDHHDEDGAADHQPGAGHHHADGPVGAINAGAEIGAAPAVAELTLRTQGAANSKGVRPRGLERPPKRSANLS